MAVEEEMREKTRPWSAFENAAVKSKAERLKHELRANEADPRARGAPSLTGSTDPPAPGPGSTPWPEEGSGQTKAPLRPSVHPCGDARGSVAAPLLSLTPLSTVRTDNKAKHELGDKQKAPKGI